MKIFVSWSGKRSRVIAEALREWLPDVLQNTEPWVSSEDIDPGTRWSDDVARYLEDTRFGIICLTPEAMQAPWVFFEAGALAKTFGSSHVCPYLIRMKPRDLKQPLAQFEAVEANKSGTLKLLRALNRALSDEDAVPDDRLVRGYERWWPDLESVIDGIPQDQPESEYTSQGLTTLGLERVFGSRGGGLTYLVPKLRGEIERSRRSKGLLYISGTSMRGFLASDADKFNGPELLEEFVKSGCDIRIMLTHPETAERRTEAERRPPDAIAGEVKQAVTQLMRLGVKSEQIRYYEGSPTVFGIATSEHMLLNPYPHRAESHRCMTLVVRKTEDSGDIYDQYFKSHFEAAWEHGVPVQ